MIVNVIEIYFSRVLTNKFHCDIRLTCTQRIFFCKINLDCNYTFRIHLASNRIPFGVKSIGIVQFQSKFGLVNQVQRRFLCV